LRGSEAELLAICDFNKFENNPFLGKFLIENTLLNNCKTHSMIAIWISEQEELGPVSQQST